MINMVSQVLNSSFSFYKTYCKVLSKNDFIYLKCFCSLTLFGKPIIFIASAIVNTTIILSASACIQRYIPTQFELNYTQIVFPL